MGNGKSIFDGKFVFTAITIGVIYTCIVLFINKVIDKDAAGVAGVALTALTTGLFTKFENLRFKENPVDAVQVTYSFNIWKILLIALFLSSLQLYVTDIQDDVLFKYGNGVADTIANRTRLGSITSINGKIILDYDWWQLGFSCLTYFLGGIIVGKSFYKTSYSGMFTAALLALILDYFHETVLDIIFGLSNKSITSDLDDYKFSFLYVVFATMGLFLVQSNKKQKALVA